MSKYVAFNTTALELYAVTGRLICHKPEPPDVVEPHWICIWTNTVLPIVLYRPVILPLPIEGFDELAVQEGLYVVQANASEATGPVGPVIPNGPVGPVKPVYPVHPVGPVKPVCPVHPVGPVKPVYPVGP